MAARARHGEQGRLLRGSAESARSALGEPTDGTSDEPFGAVHGLYWLVVHAVEDSPLALVVDDAHWADEASLRWLAYLTARMDGLPLAVVIATRAEHETRREPLLQIANGPTARTLRPKPLSVAATTALLAARAELGEHDELAIACHEATRGNPFLLHALIGDLAEVSATQAPDPNTVRALRPQAISRSSCSGSAGSGPRPGRSRAPSRSSVPRPRWRARPPWPTSRPRRSRARPRRWPTRTSSTSP